MAEIARVGGVVRDGGRAFPAGALRARNELARRVRAQGYAQVMEAMAYTWFNRLVALRYMELHELLDNGGGGGGRCFRPLSNRSPDSDIPEIVEHAAELVLPGLDRDTVIALRLAGDRDEELYALLLKAQCNALARVMPGLFERIDSATMLLIPANLLHSDSPLRKLVREIDEELWRDVEIIGWLYQFYISEKKDQVIGKVVKSEDIPAATQLFTPNWIVKYMVQNTLGRAWLATYPSSPLRASMEFYIEPAQQTPEVQAELDAITPAALDPERLTFLDPACGSGHILAVAYDLFKAIYRECGRRPREIPRLILEKNLYGLDIDDRAAQLARFTVLMKAAADDPGVLDLAAPPRLNIYALQSSQGLNAAAMADALLRQRYTIRMQRKETQLTLLPQPRKPEQALLPDYVPEVTREELDALLALFEQAKTFGSLILVPEALAAALPKFERLLTTAATWDPTSQSLAEELAPLVHQAEILAGMYDFVVTNPPYMGSNYFNKNLKSGIGIEYQMGEKDLYGCFLLRALFFCNKQARAALITIPNWMFHLSFHDLRKSLLTNFCLESIIYCGRGVWGSDFGSSILVVRNIPGPRYLAVFKKLFDRQGAVHANVELVARFFAADRLLLNVSDFFIVPGCPFTFWFSKGLRNVFLGRPRLNAFAGPKAGLSTGDNVIFQRLWFEVSMDNLGLAIDSRTNAMHSNKKWFPCNSGGCYRKWYGNNDVVVNWENDGHDIKCFRGENGKIKSATRNTDYYFRPGITWTKISSSSFAARLREIGFIFDDTGRAAFPLSMEDNYPLLALLNSSLAAKFLACLNPSMSFTSSDVGAIPLPDLDAIADKLSYLPVDIARRDWDSFETSWDFSSFPWISPPLKAATLADSFANWEAHAAAQIARMQELETENNRIFIDAYGLQDELTPEVPPEQITLARADRETDVQRLTGLSPTQG